MGTMVFRQGGVNSGQFQNGGIGAYQDRCAGHTEDIPQRVVVTTGPHCEPALIKTASTQIFPEQALCVPHCDLPPTAAAEPHVRLSALSGP